MSPLGKSIELTGRTALVTGAAQGLGRAIALALAEAGARVAVADLPGQSERAAETVAALRQLGAEATFFPVDVANRASVEAMVSAVEQELGAVDVLVNNAGINRDGLMREATEADWRRVLSVNLDGPFFCTRAVLGGMRERGWGRIIHIASVVGRTGIIGTPYYAASKSGLIGLTRAVAAEVARRGITVNAVAPGYVETAMTLALAPKVREALLDKIAVGRMARPEEVAWVVAFLASDLASYLTGAVIDVNGGIWMG